MSKEIDHRVAKRLRKELIQLEKEKRLCKAPDFSAVPSEDNLLEWYFTVNGSKDTAFEGGVYFGKLLFPEDYPASPPAIIFMTPSGRFETDMPLCITTISSFHPETWCASQTTGVILQALISFMSDDDPNHIGAAREMSFANRVELQKKYAIESQAYNSRNETYVKLFG